jgi:glucoamylase
MAAEIPALLVAAELAEIHKEAELAVYLRETADAWNEAIDRLIYVRGTALAEKAGVEGYYVRFAGPEQMRSDTPADGIATLPNHPPGLGKKARTDILSPDALCLVRFGLRDANDPRMVNTVKVIDLLCRVETPRGPCWHRYTDDGYGEHMNGAPFNGVGTGRAWPLLTGERAHYELAAGRVEEAEKLLRALEGFASDSGLLPEQVWDTNDIPEKNLYCGRPSGSAMPLVWAHAEYVKLRRSLHEGRVFDMPPQAYDRYVKNRVTARHVCWRPEQAWRSMPCGRILRLDLPAPAKVRWSADGWQTSQEQCTRDTGIGTHVLDLPTADLAAGATLLFHLETPHQSSEEFQVGVEKAMEASAAPALNGQDRGSCKMESVRR